MSVLLIAIFHQLNMYLFVCLFTCLLSHCPANRARENAALSIIIYFKKSEDINDLCLGL